MTQIPMRSRPITPNYSPSLRGAPTPLWRSLIGLWLPTHGNSGPVLRNLARRQNDLTHGGEWVATRGGLAVYNHAAADFGGVLLPIAGAEQPFSIFARIIRTNASEAGIIQQYTAAQADRMSLLVGNADRVRWSHPGQYLSAATIPLGSLATIGITEQPEGPSRIFVNGIPSGTPLDNLARCSNTNTLLLGDRDLQLLCLAIWVGRALTANDFEILHRDSNAFAGLVEFQPAGLEIAASIGPIRPHERRISMPDRPWWRRWSHRKIGY